MSVSDFDFELQDRVQAVQNLEAQYHLTEKAILAFSGGKDSCVLSRLLDIALPGNRIERVYCNTGIEYKMQVRFVRQLAEKDSRIVILPPAGDIKKMLREHGFPFKSKFHSQKVETFQNRGLTPFLQKYAFSGINAPSRCPKILSYQFAEGLPFRVSDKCCHFMKKLPSKLYLEKVGRSIQITGMRKAEGGARQYSHCVSFNKGKVEKVNPLFPVSDSFVNQFVERFQVQLSPLYYPPYNFERTGCKGCPFNIQIQKVLDLLEELLPDEKRQCELIWKEVYSEYRRIGYRLRKES